MCTQSDEHDFDEEHQTKADLLSQRGSELLTDVGKRILLFEKHSSRKSSHLRRSFHKHELKKIALEYEQKLNDLAIRKEKALIEVKQRFRCVSDNLEHVTEINQSTTTNVVAFYDYHIHLLYNNLLSPNYSYCILHNHLHCSMLVISLCYLIITQLYNYCINTVASDAFVISGS